MERVSGIGFKFEVGQVVQCGAEPWDIGRVIMRSYAEDVDSVAHLYLLRLSRGNSVQFSEFELKVVEKKCS